MKILVFPLIGAAIGFLLTMMMLEGGRGSGLGAAIAMGAAMFFAAIGMIVGAVGAFVIFLAERASKPDMPLGKPPEAGFIHPLEDPRGVPWVNLA